MRELTPAGRRILDAASTLFYDQGIHAVGVDAVARAAGVTKKTLYDCFGSKDVLVACYLQARDERWREWLTSYVDQHAGREPNGDRDLDRKAGVERVLLTFDALEQWARRENVRGCAFVNALAELPENADHPGRAVILEQKRWLLGYLTDLVKAAGIRRPGTVAAGLLVLHEGASVSFGTGVPTRAVAQARRLAALSLTGDD
ncbi:regulatory protein, tetR family [Actinopolymorpha cephalotaxi]|uniref:AcrR family transcriptional regulator n=1 Tax=Actinopolymorpha cephalotaxi TaxID=504797 RepID=A0A1I2NBC1_9ACTN|nr:TetR/AcrR family transcriptional regulator [Actinopolymorpha cephalotaxi]NYH85602.1 AcrR family transcriptional regulator [Actinopolymorpha cephalotaxi]SFG01042.1 regulatory protein, tetR family [Actinopolymorpha cephalotaxi]